MIREKQRQQRVQKAQEAMQRFGGLLAEGPRVPTTMGPDPQAVNPPAPHRPDAGANPLDSYLKMLAAVGGADGPLFRIFGGLGR
jgi:hypothetical protein